MKADELRALAESIVALRNDIDTLALDAKRFTGDDYKAATKRWWEMVRQLQKLNEELRSDGLQNRILAALDDAREQGRRDVLGGQLWAAGEFAIKRDASTGKWKRLYEEHATIVAHAAREMLRAVRHG